MGAGTCLLFFRPEAGVDDGGSKSLRGDNSEGNRGDGETKQLNVVLQWYRSLNHKKQLCWVFGKLPSELEGYLWEITWEDVKIGTELKLGEVCATTGEVNQSLVNLVEMTLTAVFGKGDDKKPKPENTTVATTAEEFRKAFDKLVT